MHQDVKLKPYKKYFGYSYAIGAYPTLELIKNQPSNILKVLISPKSSSNSGTEKIKELCRTKDIRIEIQDSVINKIAGKDNSYATGVFRKYKSKIDKDQNHLVLSGIRDMGNLGTIIRTMIGFDINNLALIKPAVDIFDPKVVRASMGAFFQINFEYFETFTDYQKEFTNNKYPFMTNGKEELTKVNFQKPYALIFGSEASGLNKNFLKIGTSIRIPQNSTIDSLNLSVAVGIALYEVGKQTTLSDP